MAKQPLPDYERPPVVETVLGVQFEPLPNLTNAHLGAFWNSLGAGWSHVQEAPAFEPQFEQFAETARWKPPGLQFKLTNFPPIRFQIKNESGNRMIQIQNGRFHLNWLGLGGADYPRYEKVSEDFFLYLDRFKQFLSEINLGDFKPNQWEVTYLNHIPMEIVWNNPAEWTFFRMLNTCEDPLELTELESFGGEWHFVIPPERGRLHVKWQHGQKNEPEKTELISLTLTARGPMAGTEDHSGLSECLELGREVIVRSFKNLMSDSANKYWGLKNDNS